ncbi:MAG: asparagine synthase (glutamine-hydrolyzing) [Elusimicrobiota bacterium]
MCGIAGIIYQGKELGPEDTAEAERMTRALEHRGPDGWGLYRDPRCILGSTRLKITDLSDEAKLPLANEKGDIWITYNGAVTNFGELKKRFGLDRGHRFRSGSDAEVLLHLYEELGIDFVNHLSGMFAFCLLDSGKRRAYLVRDFYGQRPLFYMERDGKLYFASEIKSFLELANFDKKLDEEGLHHFFSLAYYPGAHTPFAAVRELDGGHLIELNLDRGTSYQREYYTLRYAPDDSMTEDAAAKELHSIMMDAARRNLAADVPAGLTLSGGVDTGCLLTLFKELGVSRELHTFSIRMDEPSYDESAYQKTLVDFARPIHHEVSVRPADVLEHLHEHMAFLDEPSGDGAAVPMYLLARAAKPHVSILLSGEGGDEIFNAYETHRAYKARRLYRRLMPSPMRAAARSLAGMLPTSYKKLSFDFLSKRFTEGAELSVPDAHFYWRHALSDQEKARIMTAGAGLRPTRTLFSDMFERLDCADDLNKLSLIDLKYYFIGDLMVKNDRMLMAHSIEGRYPYMDRKLVEFAAKLPTRLKIKGLQGRYIQKRAMRHSLPPEIYRRSNMGLEMPHSLWFMNEFRDFAESCFSKKKVEASGLLDYRAVRSMWDDHLAHRKDNGRPLWCILNFLVWFDLFAAGSGYKRYLKS